MDKKPLIKSTRVIGAATLASRILGFIRDVLFANIFGTGMRAAAFVVAFRLPNLLRSFVGEGTTNAAIVPVLSSLKAEGKEEEFWQVAGTLLNILLVILAAVAILGELFAPYIVRAIAPGFIADAAKLELTIRLTRWLFPYIILIGLSAYAMAVLNSLRHFAIPALAPCLLNIGFIAGMLIICPRLGEPVYGVAIGILAGGLLQLAVQVPKLIQKGALRALGSGFFHPRLKEIGRLFLPRTLGIAVYQVNIFVDTIFASLALIVGPGAPAALYFANRIVQFPLALFAVALAQVALPTLSSLAAKGDFSAFKRTVTFALRSVFTMMVPATAGIMVLARPLIRVIFERGTFGSFSTEITSGALLFYCLALSGYAGIKILASAFYALKNTLTPSKVAGLALLINVILNLILMRPLKIEGLALATAISVTINFILLLFILMKRLGGFDVVFRTLGRVILASGIMGLFLWFLFYQLAVNLFLVMLAAPCVYFGALKVFAREEAGIFKEWISRRR